MSNRVLVTGGAGFIGSFLVDRLIKEGHSVRIFDSIDPQVHRDGRLPDYLNQDAEFIKGDVRDIDALRDAVKDMDVVFHQAAAVGVGQSMYEVKHYTDVNISGTANLLDILVNDEHDVKKVVVAASMSSYGEGLYECGSCGLIRPGIRGEEQMKSHDWEVHCPDCSAVSKPAAIRESDEQVCTSLYGITKKVQEDMVLNIGEAYGIPSVALRYFNTYGPRQSLNNPYTGVMAIFLSRLKNNLPPIVYEEGKQVRDFISVHDIVSANILSMEKSSADYLSLNVGTGKMTSVLEVGQTLIDLLGLDIDMEVRNKFRSGDIRHCFADISLISEKLGFKPTIELKEGMQEVIDWSLNVDAVDDFDKAEGELMKRGLV